LIRRVRRIGTLPDGLRPAATLGVAREWANADAVAALEWTGAQGHDIARNLYTEHTHATGTVLSQAIAAHPARTATWLVAQRAGEQRDAWIETAAIAGVAPRPPGQREKAARTSVRPRPGGLEAPPDSGRQGCLPYFFDPPRARAAHGL
jgi:hypothetical protein